MTPQLNTLILFVTSRCNARCKTCFYWQELNQKGDLTFEEIDRLSATMPPFRELWLSGGEPLMRDRLGDLVEMFYQRNGVRTLNLPTNGLFPERTARVCRRLAGLEDLDINLNLALDGFADTHDEIRGVPGNFQKAMECLEELYPVRRDHPNLRLHVNSVITSRNIGELAALGDWLLEHADLNGQYFQVIRGEAMDPNLKKLDQTALLEFYDSIEPIYREYSSRLRNRQTSAWKGRLKEFLYRQTLVFHNSIQASNLEHPSKWPMPCSAGSHILVIDYNGDVRACELREKVANLRDMDCDFSRLWPGTQFSAEVEQIRKDGCWCTHVCFIHDSLKASRKALLWDMPTAQLSSKTS